MSRAHLSDDRLIEISLGDPFASLDDPHLLTCDRCEERRIELTSMLREVKTGVAEEADALFPADKLARQHARIMQHVERLGRPARVLAFPGHATEPVRPVARRVRRWIAATGAVAVAFLVGIFTEHLAHQMPTSGRADTRLASRAADDDGRRTVVASVSLSDDELLGQIELAVGRTGPAVLRPLDALTPRAWDVR